MRVMIVVAESVGHLSSTNNLLNRAKKNKCVSDGCGMFMVVKVSDKGDNLVVSIVWKLGL